MSASLVVADVLVLLGVVVLTLAVWGVMRLPDTMARVHAASKAAALGAGLLLSASVTTGQVEMMVRALVVLLFLSITAPVGSHALARLEQGLLAAGKRPSEEPARFFPWTRKSPRRAAGSSRDEGRDAKPPKKRSDDRGL